MDLARWLQKDAIALEDHSLTTQERKIIKSDIPASIRDPSRLINDLLYGVEKVIKRLGKKKRHSKKGKEHYTNNDFEQHTVVKLKLKLDSKKSMDETSKSDCENSYYGNNHNTDEYAKNEHLLNNNNSNSNNTHQQPKLVIKLNKPISSNKTTTIVDQEHSSDEEYIFDEHILENDDDDEILMDSDDFEYQEDDQEDYQPITTNKISNTHKQSVNKRKAGRASNAFGKGNASDSSSSDDDMGTSKRIAGSSSLKLHNGSTKKARYSSSGTSVKQRLLDRFIKR